MFLFLLFLKLFNLVLGSGNFDSSSTSSTLENHYNLMNTKLLGAIRQRDFRKAEQLVEYNSFLVDQFNEHHFNALLCLYNHFNQDFSTTEFWDFFELLRPSFVNVSGSNTSPLIRAIVVGNMEVFSELLSGHEIGRIVDPIDVFGRTALMYACKIGNVLFINELISLSRISINHKDKEGKTALHYVCEMVGDQTSAYYSSRKFENAKLLIENGARTFRKGPEYYLSNVIDDEQLQNLLESNYSRYEPCIIEDLFPEKIRNIVLSGIFIIFFNLLCSCAQSVLFPQYDSDAILYIFFIIFLGYIFSVLHTDDLRVR